MSYKLFYPIILTLVLCATSCSSHSDSADDWMLWSVDCKSPENIKYDYMPAEISMLYLEVNSAGGDVTLTCTNHANLEPIGLGGSATYDCGWGQFTVSGRQIECHFPEDTSVKAPEQEQITISARSGGNVVNTLLRVIRTFGDPAADPEPEPLPDKYKFKLVRGALMPFMNENFTIPAPFDYLTYIITDYYDRTSSNRIPDYTQYYDSIVWCADGFPNTVRIYERSNSATSTEEHFSPYCSTHFFRSGDVRNHLKGYRDGEVAYSYTLTTTLFERDFLCYDWTNGSVVILNPGTTGIYCSLDSGYEYLAGHTQEINGTRYAQIYAKNSHSLPDAEFLTVSQQALLKLMADNVGQPRDATGMTGTFTCLPTEGVEALKYWATATTRILLVRQLPDENNSETYYLHFESK